MNALVERVRGRLRDGIEVERALELAGDLMDAAFLEFAGTREELAYQRGWSDELIAVEMTAEDAAELRRALVDFVARRPPATQLAAAVFVLGKHPPIPRWSRWASGSCGSTPGPPETRAPSTRR